MVKNYYGSISTPTVWVAPYLKASQYHYFLLQVSTVGYGDVTLKSDWGRVVILCAIVSALVILPSQINDILHLASRRYVCSTTIKYDEGIQHGI